MLRLPLDGVLRHPRWREAFFMGWSCLLIIFVTVIVLLDGGVSSPAAAVYFLPLVFAALSYPVKSMIAVAVVDVVGYVFAAVAIGGGAPTTGGFLAPAPVCAGRVWALAGPLPRRPPGGARPG